jgi:Nucleoporin autopeptidase
MNGGDPSKQNIFSSSMFNSQGQVAGGRQGQMGAPSLFGSGNAGYVSGQQGPGSGYNMGNNMNMERPFGNTLFGSGSTGTGAGSVMQQGPVSGGQMGQSTAMGGMGGMGQPGVGGMGGLGQQGVLSGPVGGSSMLPQTRTDRERLGENLSLQIPESTRYPYSATNFEDEGYHYKLCAITAMSMFKNFSFEELRMKDYSVGKRSKYGEAPRPFGMPYQDPMSQPSLFGPRPIVGAGSSFGSMGRSPGVGSTPSTGPSIGQPMGSSVGSSLARGSAYIQPRNEFGSSFLDKPKEPPSFGFLQKQEPIQPQFGGASVPQYSSGLMGVGQPQTSLIPGRPASAGPLVSGGFPIGQSSQGFGIGQGPAQGMGQSQMGQGGGFSSLQGTGTHTPSLFSSGTAMPSPAFGTQSASSFGGGPSISGASGQMGQAGTASSAGSLFGTGNQASIFGTQPSASFGMPLQSSSPSLFNKPLQPASAGTPSMGQGFFGLGENKPSLLSQPSPFAAQQMLSPPGPQGSGSGLLFGGKGQEPVSATSSPQTSSAHNRTNEDPYLIEALDFSACEEFVRKSRIEIPKMIFERSAKSPIRFKALSPLGSAISGYSKSYAKNYVPAEKYAAGEYYSVPEISGLREMKEKVVRSLVVGRQGFGKIEYLEDIELREINADELFKDVVIERGEVTVYPNRDVDVGKGLNRRARVSLEGLFAYSRSTGTEIVGKEERNPYKMVQEEFVKRLRERKGTRFISYDYDKGVWVFEAEHF